MPPTPQIQNQLLDLFLFLGSEWILHVLIVLSCISLAITLERLIHFARRRENLSRLRTELERSLARGDLDDARLLLSNSRSHVASVVLRGLDALVRGPAAVEEILNGAAQLERITMERGLAFLGTLGNNAPFIGLFGTVLGIIRAFQDLSSNSANGTSAVMAGIAEALVATAVGLLVALPAVAVFNTFQRKIRTELAATDAIARSLLAHAKTTSVRGA